MVEQLKISNIAIIEDNLLEFDSNFVSLIGETGSGKSLIVTSLSLLKGDKADYSLIKDKSNKAFISATFSIDNKFIDLNNEVKDYVNDNLIIFKRILNNDNTSKYYINDELVPLSIYKKVISHIIDIHSQGENWELFDENKHLFYLDLFNQEKINATKNEYLKKYNLFLEKKKELNDLNNDSEIDIDYINYQIEEIEKYHLKENEIENLINESNSLKDYEKLSSAYKKFQELKYLNEGKIEDVLNMVSSSLNAFTNSSISTNATKIKELINELNATIKDFEHDFISLDINPSRIDQINQRLFDLKSLQRKYGQTTSDILNKLQEYKDKIDLASNVEQRKKKLSTEIDNIYSEVVILGEKLTKVRLSCAKLLEENISVVLKELNFNDNGFKVNFDKVEPSINGLDKVSFTVRLNKGMEYQSLVKACSGGEASRLMLALKIILNKLNPYNLIVLDEIDTGVSGFIASLIGKKIKELSSSSQIILISHLPQVIVFSTSQLKISKINKNNKTISTVCKINEEEYVNEIAKMLSLNKINDEAIIQARKLISEAK